MAATSSEQRRWTVRPMQCMAPGCNEYIPIHRRALRWWFCSGAHYRQGRDAGVIEAVYRLAADRTRDPRNNPLTPMRCLVCGMRIGLENRLRRRWFCTEACYEIYEKPEESGDYGSRRDFLGIAAASLAAAAIWTTSQSIPRMILPDLRPPGDWVPDGIARLFPINQTLRFDSEPALLKQWRVARDAWEQSGDGAWRPLRSMASKLVSSFRQGSVEFTSRGGIGFLFRAAQDLSVYHSVAFQPLRNRAGRILDYQLLRANWAGDRPTAEWDRVPLELGAKRAREESSFRVIKQGDYFEAAMSAPGGGWNIAARWYERTLPEGAVGLFVGQGHNYGIVSGRISP